MGLLNRSDVPQDPQSWGRVLLAIQLCALFFSPAIANLSELLLILLFVSSPTLRRDFITFFRSHVGRYYLLFLLFLFLGMLVAVIRDTVDYSALISWRKILLLPVAAVVFQKNEQAKVRFLLIFLLFSMVFSLIAMFSWGIGNTHAIVRNSSTQSVFFAVAVIAGFYVSQNVTNTYSQFFGLASLAVSLAGLIMVTQGRSGYLSLVLMIVGTAVLLGQSQKLFKKLLIGVVLATVSAGLMFVSPVSNQRIDQAVNEFKAPLLEGENTSMGQRKIFWSNSLKMVPEFWLFGTGVTGFGKAYAAQVSDQAGPMAMLTNDPHNQYLRIFLEQGFVGLLIFLALLATIARTGLKSQSGRLGVCVLIGWCATSLFSAHFTTFAEGRFVWIWLGVFIGSLSLEKSPKE